MATRTVFQTLPPSDPCTARAEYSTALRSLALLIVLFLYSFPARAQLQQPFVFTVNPANPLSIAVYARNDLTGILTPVPGSPFPSRESVNVMTLDFKGRFLFTASFNPSKISMFVVDPNTGALQEVPNSPFASLSTNDPVFLSTDSSGQFLYVINFNGSQAGASSFEFFQIDSVNLDLIPSSTGATQLPGLFLSGATHPSGRSFYAFLSAPFASIPGQAFFLLFDSSTGIFTIPNPNMGISAGTFGCCLALDPQGKSLALGVSSLLTIYSLQADGTLALNPASGAVNGEVLSMAFDTFGRFLYVGLPQTPTNPASVRVISPVTLLETSNSPLPSSFPSPGSWIVDPTAPLLFADQVYQIDPQTGLPSSILPTNSLIQPAVFSKPPGTQPIVGPIALLSATSFSFGSLPIGQASSAQTLIIASNGGQALSLNKLAITGANPGDFAETDTCHVPTVLQPGNSCSALIVFSPSATGSRSAALTITSNASPATESAQLSGTGLAPAPAVTLVPGSLDFGTLTQGSSASLNVSATNSGTAPLHITTVVLGGANANDYNSSSPTCNSAVAVNSACTIIVTFTPLASGLRSATVTVSDDSPGSPQTIAVKGTGLATGPGVTFSPAVPSFPTITQGTSGGAQTLTVTNSGTTSLHISSVVLAGLNASDFNLANNCTAPVAPTISCTVSLGFNPLAAGQRTANLTIADDAPGSPQTIPLNATANPAFTPGPASNGSTTASISAGQTAQFQLQLTPGAGYSGIVSLACSGAPLGATCQVPATVTIANGAPAPFTVTVSTKGAAGLPPSMPWRFPPPARIRVLLLLAFAMLLVTIARNHRISDDSRGAGRLALGGALIAILLCSVIYATGCGSGSAVTTSPPIITPPSVVTPSGTSTITITPAAMSSSGQPLQLPPIQLTLTVK
jgi:hypothetical protein